jgi:Rps23 Pro-64 3,4-dihydroxylase Tpa1-like proline 4-hydroxylase
MRKNCTLLRLKKQAKVATSNDVPPNWLGNITEKLYSSQIEKNITEKLRSAQIEPKNITKILWSAQIEKKTSLKIMVCSNLQKTSLKTGPKLRL